MLLRKVLFYILCASLVLKRRSTKDKIIEILSQEKHRENIAHGELDFEEVADEILGLEPFVVSYTHTNNTSVRVKKSPEEG